MKLRLSLGTVGWLFSATCLLADDPRLGVESGVGPSAPIITAAPTIAMESHRLIGSDQPVEPTVNSEAVIRPVGLNHSISDEPPVASEQDITPASDASSWKPIGQVGLRVQPPAGMLPQPTVARPQWYSEQPIELGAGGSRNSASQVWSEDHDVLELPPAISVTWEPTELWYRPLYFEDANLERYGYRYGPAQSLVSAAHFFGRVPLIPYMRGAQPANQPVAALGYQRPGGQSMVPTRPTLVPHPRGSLYQAGATVGGIFIVP